VGGKTGRKLVAADYVSQIEQTINYKGYISQIYHDFTVLRSLESERNKVGIIWTMIIISPLVGLALPETPLKRNIFEKSSRSGIHGNTKNDNIFQ